MFLLCSTVCETRPLTPPLLLPGPPTSHADYGWQPGTQPAVDSDCFMPSLRRTSASPFQMPSLTFSLATKRSGIVVVVVVQITVLFIRFYLLWPTDTIISGCAVHLGIFINIPSCEIVDQGEGKYSVMIKKAIAIIELPGFTSSLLTTWPSTVGKLFHCF